MKNVVFLLLFVFGYGPLSFGQNLPPIIKKMYDYKGRILPCELNNTNYLNFPDLPKNYQGTGQSFIKTDKQLLLLPKGTGRIYRLDSKKGNFSWTRIDSTVYIGYNFGCIAFEYKNVIYSFGGDGFWSTNGTLRFYNEKANEWNAKSLSESIHVSFPPGGDNFYYLDTTHGKLYVRTHHVKHDPTVKQNVDTAYSNTVYALDLSTGDWEKLGKSSYEILLVGPSPWGPMIDFNHIVDLKRNTILEFNEKAKQRIMAIIANSTSDNIRNLGYFIDSVYYFGNYTGFYDSIAFSRSDLIDTGKPFYVNNQVSSFSSIKGEYAVILILSIFSTILLWINFGRKRKHTKVNNSDVTSNEDDSAQPTETLLQPSFKSSKIIDLLDGREKLLLKLLYEHSSDERLTSIEEINRVIGVLNRTTEIQKRLRSDVITSINNKLSILHNEKKPVVDKQRSEFDKRSFEYFIQPVHMGLVEKVIG